MINPRFVEVSHISPVLHEKIRKSDNTILLLRLSQYLQVPRKIIIKGVISTKKEKSDVINGPYWMLAKEASNPATLERPM